jgi:hypothetical protein
MIEFDYNVTFDRTVLNLENRLLGGTRQSMKAVVDVLVDNIKNRFDDQKLADTVVGTVDGTSHNMSADDYAITGHVTSTWPEMIWYEQGRPAGGKMPSTRKIAGWAVRQGIKPDPVKTQIAFAYAINAVRARNNKHKVPVDILVEWQRKSGVVPSAEFAINSMAFAIALKIQRDGLPGHHYFAQGLAEARPVIAQTFENAVVSTTAI